MLTHIFKCPHCNSDMAFRSFGFKARVNCTNCNHQYIVVKNFMFRILETFLLLSLASLIIMFAFPVIENHFFIIIVIFCILLIVGNILFDILIDHVLKYKKYYTLIEKTMPIDHQS